MAILYTIQSLNRLPIYFQQLDHISVSTMQTVYIANPGQRRQWRHNDHKLAMELHNGILISVLFYFLDISIELTGYEIFMKSCREQKCCHHSWHLTPATRDHRQIHVSHTPRVHWSVPPSPELLHGAGIPPAQVEPGVSGAGHLWQQLQVGDEDDVETHEPRDDEYHR